MDKRGDDTSLPGLATDLWDLVRAYAKQETIEPIKGIGRFVAFGVAGSLLLGVGSVLVALAILRALQTETGSVFDGNWSFAPYLLTLLVCVGVIGAAVAAMQRKGDERVNRTTAVGEGATVSRDDIEQKLREIRGEAGDVAESGRNYAVIAAVVAVVAVVAVSYLFGQRKGKKRSTVVEVRRV